MSAGEHNHRQMDETIKTQTLEKLVENFVNKGYPEFKPVQHTTQVVSGINHKYKIQVGKNVYIHAKIHENTKGELSVLSVDEGKTLSDAL
ncbi:hypothetical protein C9374_013459 [Naegleria lovaniensis]|uniref:Cystatin domain-containing protein n=1 Tax=Naegleria lovaniensis TaxID=51637 RepID=A0AA88KQP2_NAELO|nr:uncharacterized protein C9374_013459 [Naegleria lovaniensis]KAG2391974.1 hypothetical protein C9374_013459 [Naegleria lovaniensis]